MSTRLASSFDPDFLAGSPELVAGDDLTRRGAGITECLEGKKHALVVTDIAELLSISERQVYKLVATHRIPCFKIGGSIRFDPVAISAWLRRKMAPSFVEHRRERETRT